MDPVVCVEVGEEKKYTSMKESTNCPYYNEVRTRPYKPLGGYCTWDPETPLVLRDQLSQETAKTAPKGYSTPQPLLLAATVTPNRTCGKDPPQRGCQRVVVAVALL